MIWFDGVSSEEMSVFVEKIPSRIIPTRKVERISIPGRSGDLIFPQDAFENYEQKYEIYISAKRQKIINAARAVVEWLVKPGYKRLEDSYDPEVYRMANFQSGVEIENYLMEYGRATIAFDCMPQRWLKSGEQPITIQQNGTLHNPSAMEALPLIQINGSGAGTLTVGDETISFAGIEDFLIIDSENMQCYKGAENCNRKMTGEFPRLGKETEISWTGGIQSAVITPRWFTI